MEDYDLDEEEAEEVQELMDDLGLDADEVNEIREAL